MAYKKTPLFEEHKTHGGKMVEFAGYSLPISYSSINEEHNAVREKVGVFDVSHMVNSLFQDQVLLIFFKKSLYVK